MELAIRPDFSEYEPRLAKKWEDEKLYEAKIDPSKKPFSILLPPPNANAPLHAGHVLYVVEDILCRYHRMLGEPALFLPGTDHAGIETQYVFEKKLSKEGKSRFDFDRETLYKMIDKFVEENRGIATKQLRRLGFSLDWSREKYTLDPKILETVFATFRKLVSDELIYRDERLVNYCAKCGTGFSNLEVDHDDRTDELYYINYGPLTIATTRPETIFADVAIAVNPTDTRYTDLVGKTAVVPIIQKEIPIIADPAVQPEFGTGALKITPGHDQTDFEIGERHHLPRISVVSRSGRMINVPDFLRGQKVKDARTATLTKLTETGELTKTEPLTHSVAVCYKCNTIIEPLLVPQWYLNIVPLIKKVKTALDENQVQLFPARFKDELRRWLASAPAWNISRQIVWGPRIPAWYCMDCYPENEITFLSQSGESKTGSYKELIGGHTFAEIAAGLQTITASPATTYQLTNDYCSRCGGKNLLQETDTFDTWFSSGQWPLTTLDYPDGDDFKYFYPTTVLDTMWDILPFWVMRMLLLALHLTDEVPFKTVHLHSRVVDAKGQKMSKSKGNVINPMELTEKYGADALRFALVFGVAPASDIPLGEEKLIGGRNFVTKLWNIGRFFITQLDGKTLDDLSPKAPLTGGLTPDDLALQKQLDEIIEHVTRNLNDFEFSAALDNLYDFIWNQLASIHIEAYKKDPRPETFYILVDGFTNLLKQLHPFMPFITEELYQHLTNKKYGSISLAPWPHSPK